MIAKALLESGLVFGALDVSIRFNGLESILSKRRKRLILDRIVTAFEHRLVVAALSFIISHFLVRLVLDRLVVGGLCRKIEFGRVSP